MGSGFEMLNGFLGTVLPFLLVLTIIVFVHEFGHFIVARLCGVTVTAFSIGFGPELFGFYDRHGTRWRLAAIPLGGYVKFLGDLTAYGQANADFQPSNHDQGKIFQNKSLAQRAAIVAAGPLANFLFAIVIFALTFAINGRTELLPRIDEVAEASPAAEAGLMPGDLILAVNDSPITTFYQLQQIVRSKAGIPLNLTLDRQARVIDISVTPEMRETTNGLGESEMVGQLGIRSLIRPKNQIKQTYTPLEAVWAGTGETVRIVTTTVGYIGGLIRGRESVEQLGGPIRIAQVSGKVAEHGIAQLVNFMAILSVSIGFLNLLPIPILDGGHLVFYALEAIRGKPLSERIINLGFRLGLAFVLMLMVFVTWKDIARWITL